MNVDPAVTEILLHLDALCTRAAALRGTAADPDTQPRIEVSGSMELVAQRFLALVERLELSGLDEQLLVVLLAAELCVPVRELARRNDVVGSQPWLELGTVAALLGGGAALIVDLANRLGAGLPVAGHALIEEEEYRGRAPLAARRLKMDSSVVDRLVRGSADLDRTIVPAPVFMDDASKAGLRRRVADAARAGRPILVEIAGPKGTGRRALAVEMAQWLGHRGVVTGTLAPGWTRSQAIRLAAVLRRDALLERALPCVILTSPVEPERAQSAETADDEHRMGESKRPSVDNEGLEALAAIGAAVVLIAENPTSGLERSGVPVARLSTHFPSPGERARVMEGAIAQAGATVAEGVDLWQLGRRYALDGARLLTAVRAALDACALRGGDEGAATLSFEDLQQGCRQQVTHELLALATRVTTHHAWEDLVIPVEVYEGLVAMGAYVRHGRRVYEQWGFAEQHSLTQGVTALFTGPPGTGKTMCATVMARELDMELFRVDLSRVASKWIGETEKNLGRIFDDAQRSHAIILFDEADSLFARRTEVKSSTDRYGNQAVSYLLVRMEEFSGLTILTSNFEDTIDAAFKRRIHFKLRFEKPDAAARAALWRKVFPRSAPLGKDFDPVALAERFDMTGANIRNAAVRAAFLAADLDDEGAGGVTQALCMEAAEREAREMGVLTRVAPRAEPPEPATLPPRPPKGEGPLPSRLVPVTHPRRR